MESHSNGIESKTSILKRINYTILVPVIVVVLIGGFFAVRAISSSVWKSRLASTTSVNSSTDEFSTFIYEIEIETEAENQVNFESSIVAGGNRQFHVSSCDLLIGNNTLHYTLHSALAHE